MDSNCETRNFWEWFKENAAMIALDPENPVMVAEIDVRVDRLDPRLSWEIGPGQSRPWQLVISPDLNPGVRDRALEIVSASPDVSDWEFHAARPPKDWTLQFELTDLASDRTVAIDANNWQFALLKNGEGLLDIEFKATDLHELSDKLLWQAGAIVLECMVGEDAVMDRLGDFEFVSQFSPGFSDQARPIQELCLDVVREYN